MKIAIFEPSPRVCGPTIWAGHVRTGFRALGHDADIVSVSLSGKPSSAWGEKSTYTYGFAWCAYTPDVVVKPSNAGFVLDKYDLILLAEPKCSPLDRNVYRKEISEIPLYIEVLQKTKTPWVTFLHGPQYGWDLAPFLEQVFAAGNFTGHVFTPQISYAQPENRFEGMNIHVVPCLPYAMRPVLGVPRTGVIGFAGRAVVNKGPQLLVELARTGRIQNDVEIWGASAVGVGPSMTRSMYELLATDKWQMKLIYDETRHKPDVLRPHRWTATNGTRRVEYCGNYVDPMAVFPRFQVHVNLTSVDFSYGLIEYVGLEALNAGCLGVYPPHTLGAAPYEVMTIAGFERPPAITQKVPPSVRMDRIDSRVVDNLVDKINTAMSYSTSEQQLIADTNREVISKHHDPRDFAQMVIDVTAASRT